MYNSSSESSFDENDTSSFSSSSSPSSSSSFSSSSLSSSSSMTRNNNISSIEKNMFINTNHGTKMTKKKKYKFLFMIISIIIINIILIFINFFIIILFIKIKTKTSSSLNDNINNDDNLRKKYEYQLIYHIDQNIKNDGNDINEIVSYENELDFEGSFYPFEDENGHGIIVKINNEKGDEYEICSHECKCFIDDDDDIYGNKRRKETNGEMGMRRERKFAQVVTVPLLMCVFGIFTSMYFAQEYGNQYFSEKCEELCPKGTSKIEVQVDDTDIEKRSGRKNIYHCEGRCFLDVKHFHSEVEKNVEEIKKNYDKEIIENQFNDQMTQLLYKHNQYHLAIKCKKMKFEEDIIADSDVEALEIFTAKNTVSCKQVTYLWKYDIDLQQGGRAYSYFHDFGQIDDSCIVETAVTECILVEMTPNLSFEP